MKRIEALHLSWKGFKTRRAQRGFGAIPSCDFPIQPHTERLITKPIQNTAVKPSERWSRVFDAHHPQEPLGQIVTES